MHATWARKTPTLFVAEQRHRALGRPRAAPRRGRRRRGRRPRPRGRQCQPNGLVRLPPHQLRPLRRRVVVAGRGAGALDLLRQQARLALLVLLLAPRELGAALAGELVGGVLLCARARGVVFMIPPAPRGQRRLDTATVGRRGALNVQ